MKIVHHISEKANPEILNELESLGVTVDQDSLNIASFQVDESDERWPAIQQWTIKQGIISRIWTEFSNDEITNATWLKLVAEWHYGYPQPKADVYGYLAATYDLQNYCERCDIGKIQRAPFQMKGEPKWGRRGILQMNWVFDEFFAIPAVWSKHFKPYGVDCRPVFNTKGKELATVAQLVVPEFVPIKTDRLEGYRCELCGLIKYRPFTRGFFPALTSQPRSHMIKTREYFGSGASAWQATLVSQQLAAELRKEKVRGVQFWPLAE